jgi:hypothetical protein
MQSTVTHKDINTVASFFKGRLFSRMRWLNKDKLWMPVAVFATWQELKETLHAFSRAFNSDSLVFQVAMAQGRLPVLRTGDRFLDCVVIPFGLPLAGNPPLVLSGAARLHFPSPIEVDDLLPANTGSAAVKKHAAVKNAYEYVMCLLNAEYLEVKSKGSTALVRAYVAQAAVSGYVPAAVTKNRLDAARRAAKMRKQMSPARKLAVKKYQKIHYKDVVKPAYDRAREHAKYKRSLRGGAGKGKEERVKESKALVKSRKVMRKEEGAQEL